MWHTDVPPLVAPRAALCCAIAYTVLYIAPFYVSPTLRSTPLVSRDAPRVIQARVRAVGFTCLVCTLITVYVLVTYGQATPRDVLRLLGVWPTSPLDVARVAALLAVLFAAPLYERVVVDGDARAWSPAACKEGLFDSWVGYRNFVVAPASEELVFRALTISLYLLAKVDPPRIVFLTPLVFGLAHVHHLVEFVQARTPDGRRCPAPQDWLIGVLRSLFQFAFTSLFGFFAAFVFLRTGNLFAAILAHAFCNWMGVPRLWGRLGQRAPGPPHHLTPDVAQGKRHDPAVDLLSPGGARDAVAEKAAAQHQQQQPQPQPQPEPAPRDLSLGWTVAYYVLLVAGAFAFYRLLFPWTESTHALASF